MSIPWPPRSDADVEAWLGTVRDWDTRVLSNAEIAAEMALESVAESRADGRVTGAEADRAADIYYGDVA